MAYKAANRPAINIDRLCEFATSVFWRYSVASWPSGNTVRLGPYGEEFRHYLRGGDFPKTARLMLFISRLTAKNAMVMMPNTVKGSGFLLHQFVIPGFDFMLAVGKNVPLAFDKFCLSSSSEKPILVSERSDTRRLNQVYRAMALADATRAMCS